MEHESIFHDPLANFGAYELNRDAFQEPGRNPRKRKFPKKTRSGSARLEAIAAVSQDLARLASLKSSAYR